MGTGSREDVAGLEDDNCLRKPWEKQIEEKGSLSILEAICLKLKRNLAPNSRDFYHSKSSFAFQAACISAEK